MKIFCTHCFSCLFLLLKTFHLGCCRSALFRCLIDLSWQLLLVLLCSLLLFYLKHFCLPLLVLKLELKLLYGSLLLLGLLLGGQLALHLRLEELLLALSCLGLLAQVVLFGLLNLSKNFVFLLQLLSRRRLDQLLPFLLVLELSPELLDDFERLLLIFLSLNLLQSTKRLVALFEALKRFDSICFLI